MGQRATPNTSVTTASGAPTTDGRSPSLWFGAPSDDQDRRPQLTRERIVDEALAVIAHDGAQALTMRQPGRPPGGRPRRPLSPRPQQTTAPGPAP